MATYAHQPMKNKQKQSENQHGYRCEKPGDSSEQNVGVDAAVSTQHSEEVSQKEIYERDGRNYR